jgi:hypothetical protein
MNVVVESRIVLGFFRFPEWAAGVLSKSSESWRRTNGSDQMSFGGLVQPARLLRLPFFADQLFFVACCVTPFGPTTLLGSIERKYSMRTEREGD